MREFIPSVFLFSLSVLFLQPASAENRLVEGVNSYFLKSVVADTSTPYIFAGDWYNKQLLVIDSKEEKVVNKFSVDSTFSDLEISKDHKYLAIAGDSLHVLNLNNWELTQMPLGLRANSVAFDHKNDLFISTRSGGWDPLSLYDLDTQSVIWQSKEPAIQDIYGSASLDTNAGGTTLFASEFGTPGEVNNYDVSSDDPAQISFIASNNGRAINNSVYADQRDQLVTTDYNIQVWGGDNLSLVHEESIGIHLRGLDVDPQGNYVYTVYDNWGDESQIELLKYNLLTSLVEDRFALETTGIDYLVRELAVDYTGNKVFVLVSDSYYPYDGYTSQIEIIDVNDYRAGGVISPTPPVLPRPPLAPQSPFAPTSPYAPNSPTKPFAPASVNPVSGQVPYLALREGTEVSTLVNPEPGSLLLFGFGLAGAAFTRRLRMRMRPFAKT